MEKRRIGSVEVSVVGVGCNNFGGRIDESRTDEVVHAALDVGINFFDTADMYGAGRSEEILGRRLGTRRAEAVIATKFGVKVDETHLGGAAPEYVRSAAEKSLRRLGSDYIDLYQLHRPDPSTPIAETLGALAELVAEGKVREIGCSHFSVEQLREAASAVGAGQPGFVSVQNEYSLLRREADMDMLPECEHAGLSFLPFFPLQSGMLTGKYRRGEALPEGSRLANFPPDYHWRTAALTDRNFGIVEALADFAKSRGHTILDVAFARLVANHVIPSVIAGATSADQVRANAATVKWRLTADEISAIDKLTPIV